jgi:hypothetical protein
VLKALGTVIAALGSEEIELKEIFPVRATPTDLVEELFEVRVFFVAEEHLVAVAAPFLRGHATVCGLLTLNSLGWLLERQLRR